MKRWGSIVLCLSLIGCTSAPPTRERAVADALRKLETRVAAMEAEGGAAKHLQPGPTASRAASLRAGADYLEKAEVARKKGDAGRAAQLFQSAVDEVGADVLVDVEPLFRKVSFSQDLPTEPRDKEAPPSEPSAAAPTPATVNTSMHPSTPAHPAHERAVLSGALKLDGPYAADGGMGVVLLQPIGRAVARSPRHASVEQRKKDFLPHVLEIATGSTVSFPNADPVFHNVFSISDTRKFDLGLYKNGDSKDITFNKPGVVRLLCNLHAAMNAYLVVHDEPYAVVTDRGGRFHVRDLPPGRYKLRAWNERTRELVSREIELEAGQNHLFIPMKADVAPLLGPDKEGKPRGPQTPHS